METLILMTTSRPSASLAPGTGGLNHRPARVLYVDDDALQQRISGKVLQELGCDVVQAKDGREAWDLFQQKPFDFVITDNEMPHLTGLELIGRLRMHGMHIPVILASSSAARITPTQQESLRLTARLQKPFAPSQLVQAVQPILLSVLSTPTTTGVKLEVKISFTREPTPYQHWGINE